MFHRLTVPSYFGGLPGGYDYINNATSGTPANANGQIPSGVNAGSYFVGFQDDGTSADANRPAKALAQNTDFLDDLMHADLAKVVQTANVTAGAPVPSITLTGPGVFLGISGGTPLTELFQITDANDNDIHINGARIVVASISGGVVGGGFSAGSVTLTLNLSIPTGVTYRVYYGFRTNLATLPADAFFEGRLGRGDLTDFLDFVKQVSQPGTLPGTVTAVVGTVFATPDGTRLPQSSSMFLSVDPEDSGSPTRALTVQTRENTVNAIDLFTLFDDPTSTLFTGVTSLAILHAPSGMGVYTVDHSTGAFSDNNIAGGAPLNFTQVIPWSSSTATDGDQYIRTQEVLPTSGSPGTRPESILQRLNAQWSCTIGNGTTTFGDYNGATALDTAVAVFLASGSSDGFIRLKPGTYSIASTHTITSKNLRLEGFSPGDTSIDTAGTVAFDVTGAAARLFASNISFTTSAASVNAVQATAGAAVQFDNVSFLDTSFSLLDAGELNNGYGFVARDCTFEITSGTTAVVIGVSDLSEHFGYLFEDCTFSCNDGTNPVTLRANGANYGTISGVYFRNCQYFLGGTTTTSGHMTANTSVLSVDPQTSGLLHLVIADVTWEDCQVQNTTSTTNGPVVYVSPVVVGASSATNVALIRNITIRGGKWSASANTRSAFNPFFISAMHLTLADVEFVGTTSAGNAPGSDIFWVLTTSPATADWGQFSFAPSSSYTLIAGDMSIHFSNVSFSGFTQASDAGDLHVEMPAENHGFAANVRFDNVRLNGYVAGGTGGPPNFRVNLLTQNYGTLQTNALISQLTLFGTAGHLTDSWALESIVGINPSSGLTLDNCGVFDFVQGTGTPFDIGFGIVFGATSDAPYGITLRECNAGGMGIGFLATGGTGSSLPLDGLKIIGGDYSNNANFGIEINPSICGEVTIDRVRCVDNGAEGIAVVLPSAAVFPGSTTQFLHMSGNMCRGNNSDADQILVQSDHAADLVRMIAVDNTCLTSFGTISTMKVNLNSGATAIPTPANYPAIGVETGIAALGDAGNNIEYVNNKKCMRNYATLVTP